MTLARSPFSSAFRLVAVLLAAVASGAALAQSAACLQIPQISGTASGAGATSGIPGVFSPGERVTISATLGTATAATYRIVGEPAGAVTLAGPANVPGSLSYTVTGPLPPPSIGIGWFLDTTNGTVNITATCALAPVEPVPTLSTYGLVATMLLLVAFAGWRTRRVR